jgi:hypothetical protein
MNSTALVLSTRLDVNASHHGTLYQPNQHGWSENILSFKVADELHRAALTRPFLETAPSIVRPAAATMSLIPRQREISFLPPEAPPVDVGRRAFFVGLQEWEGVVTLVREDGFTARLIDLTHTNPDEEADFSTSEMSPDDFDLVVPGAIFRWSVGVLKMPGGAKRPTSQVVFRRLPQWTKRDLDRADALAEELVGTLEKIQTSDDNDTRSAR